MGFLIFGGRNGGEEELAKYGGHRKKAERERERERGAVDCGPLDQ